MGFRSNIRPTGRQFHFNPAGEDRLDGKGEETAVETPTRAIALVNALDPPPSGQVRASIVSSADGVYPDGVVLPAFTSFNAPSTSIVTSDSVNIAMAESQPMSIGSLLNFAPNCTLVLIDGLDRVDATVTTMVVGSVFAADCRGFVVSGSCGQVFARLTTGSLQGGGATLIEHTASCTTPFDYNIDVVTFFGTNQTLLDFNPPGPLDQANVNLTSAQRAVGFTTTGSLLFNVRAGRMIVKAEVLSAETLCVVEDGARFSLDVQVAFGSILVKNGAIAVVKSAGILVGDITVDAGGELSINLATHVGALVDNGEVNGWINGVPYGNAQERTLLRGASFVNQAPPGLDQPIQVTFGPAQGGASDDVMLSATGVLTANVKHRYKISVFLQYGRTGAGQFSKLFFRLLLNGAQIGDSVEAKLDSRNSDVPVQLSALVPMGVGDELTGEFVRDSGGGDSGELISDTPALGWNAAPSAVMRVNI